MHGVAQIVLLAGAAILLMGAAGGEQVHRPLLVVPRNPPVPAGLRGFQLPAPLVAKTPPPAVVKTLLAPLGKTGVTTTQSAAATSAAISPAVDAHQCRIACARPYYFCLAGQETGVCPVNWSRCVASCDTPSEAEGNIAQAAATNAAR
jgi:hypothetical protein